VHAILEGYSVIAAILKEGPNGIKILCLARFKAHRVVEHEAGILTRLDLFVNIGHTALSVRYRLWTRKDDSQGSSQE
jgi:hypothetical protein